MTHKSKITPATSPLLGRLKMREWKTQDWKTGDQIAGVEKAGLENTGPKCRAGAASDF